jgi:uncharacterized protein
MTAADIRVMDVPERPRFEALVDGEIAGFTEYRRHPGLIAFVHTVIDPRFEGHGLGSLLVRTALSDAHADGLSVLPFCPFVRAYIAGLRDRADQPRLTLTLEAYAAATLRLVAADVRITALRRLPSSRRGAARPYEDREYIERAILAPSEDRADRLRHRRHAGGLRHAHQSARPEAAGGLHPPEVPHNSPGDRPC